MRFNAHILTHVNDAIVGLDTRNLINYWNTGAQKLYGLEASQVLGKPLQEAYNYRWLKEEDEQRAMQELAQKGVCSVDIIHLPPPG